MASPKARYDHYRLYRVHLATDEQLKTFQELEARSDSYVFYGHARVVGQKVTLMVAAHKIAEFAVDILDKYGVQYELLECNMQRKMDVEATNVLPKDTKAENFDWEHYFHLETINNWLEKCVSEYSFVSSLSLGDSFEGLPIKGVKIAFGGDEKPAIFVEGGIHAREWISPATATYILNEILTSKDEKIVDLRENYTWYFFPVVNPDGYKFTFEHDRLWRKNRQPHSLVYKGVDLNRNFDSAWNGNGSSADPANYDYAGSKAFSEPESAAIAKFILENGKKIKSYIALHSYSQLVMFPFGHTAEPIRNYEDHKRIVEKAKIAIHETHGKVYNVGSKHETIYPSSGGSIDWAYDTGKIPISVTFELRGPPDSADMFILPAEEIIPTAQEALAAFIAIVNEAKLLGYYKNV
ncbi:zinc carboxypeptidase-like [Culicoides brevitarsis]|uniref:zinc carboxypeptidase-like n=1 Tax=Culicoides brevitarsis TaxID=469753 RepID=UPI00307C65D1